MPLLEGVTSKEAPNLLGYGNVACVVKDGTADDRKSPLVHPSGFFITTLWSGVPGPTHLSS